MRRGRLRVSSTRALPTTKPQELDFAGIPATRTQVMLNLANPAAAFRWWRLPADGVGLARMEFIVSNLHQGASDGLGSLRRRSRIEDAKRAIAELTEGYAGQDRILRGPSGPRHRPHRGRVSTRSRRSCA